MEMKLINRKANPQQEQANPGSAPGDRHAAVSRSSQGTRLLLALAFLLGSSACRSGARAQEIAAPSPVSAEQSGDPSTVVASSDNESAASSVRTVSNRASRKTLGSRMPASRMRFRSRTDSLSWVRAIRTAQKARGFRIEVSLSEKQLWVINDRDTLRTAPIAVGMGEALEYQGRRWFFATPRGTRKVLRKESDPVWIPPEWAYAEVAREYGLKLTHMPASGRVKLKDGRVLTVRDSLVGLLEPSEDDAKKLEFAALPTDEHIVFDNTLFIPPSNTKNRRISGELGKYRLDLGEGYLLHGTPHQDSIGRAATHGCVRLLDEDIQWLYENIPVGTRVFIY